MRKLAVIYVLLSVFLLNAQSPLFNTNAKMKATYIYNFAVNTNFPTARKTGDFLIGIYGDDTDLVQALGMLKGRKVGSQEAKVQQITNISQTSSCHILYVTHHRQNELSTIVNKLKGKNVLLILEGRSPLQATLSGYGIGFFPVNNRWVFDINNKTLHSEGLAVTSKLQNLANKVHDR